MFPRTLVIIPAYNEAGTVGEVITSIQKELPQTDILVVNDGSEDATVEVIRGMGVKIVNHPFNLGIGATMQTGYRYAASKSYDIVVQVDADGQHPPDQIRHLIRPIKERKADIVIGSRFLRGEYNHSMARWVGMKIFSSVVSAIVRQRLTDTTSGFRAANKEVINLFSQLYPEDYPEVEALVLLSKANLKIMEVPVRIEARKSGTSSITPLRSIYYMIKVLLAIFVDLLKKIKRL